MKFLAPRRFRCVQLPVLGCIGVTKYVLNQLGIQRTADAPARHTKYKEA